MVRLWATGPDDPDSFVFSDQSGSGTAIKEMPETTSAEGQGKACSIRALGPGRSHD